MNRKWSSEFEKEKHICSRDVRYRCLSFGHHSTLLPSRDSASGAGPDCVVAYEVCSRSVRAQTAHTSYSCSDKRMFFDVSREPSFFWGKCSENFPAQQYRMPEEGCKTDSAALADALPSA